MFEKVDENLRQDQDSGEFRKRAYDNFVDYLEKINFEDISQKDKLDWIKNASFDEFMDKLFALNGILQGKENNQKWEGKIHRSVIAGMNYEIEDAELDPPKKADLEFKKLFLELQDKISEDSVKRYSIKLSAGVIFSHMFEDGNGRTARNIYCLMNSSDIPKLEIMKSNPRITQFFRRLNLYSMMQCLIKDGLKVENIEEMEKNYYTTNNRVNIGSMSHLQYLAIRRMFEKNGVEFNKNQFELSELTFEQKEKYNNEYEKIKKEWWWEIQKTVDDNEDWAKEEMDSAIFKKRK